MPFSRDHRSHHAIFRLLAVSVAFAASACGETTASGDAPVVFDDPHREGARLTVVEFGDGLGVSVTAPIGVPVPSGRGLSLVELYRLLHPDAEVPRALVPLSARAEALVRNPVSSPDAVTPEVPAVAVDKSESDFFRLACVTFEEWGHRYTPMACKFTSSHTITHVPGPPCGANCYPITFDDRTFVWNENAFTTHVVWFNPAHDNREWTVPANRWGWYSLSAPGSQTWAAQITTYPHNVIGTMGITWHNHSLIEPR
jgi:hypothetical protein